MARKGNHELDGIINSTSKSLPLPPDPEWLPNNIRWDELIEYKDKLLYGYVTRVTTKGVFVKLNEQYEGLIHKSFLNRYYTRYFRSRQKIVVIPKKIFIDHQTEKHFINLALGTRKYYFKS